MKTSTVLILAPFILCSVQSAKPQADSLENLVTAKDALTQLDAAIFGDEFNKRPASETLVLLKEMIKLNQLQIDIAESRRLERETKQEGKYHPGFMTPNDFNQTFYDLRSAVCKRYSGMVVDLDGSLRHCP